jgi:hypothetical protein
MSGTRCPDRRSDRASAMTLANSLRVDAHLHRQLPADSELCQAIALPAQSIRLTKRRGILPKRIFGDWQSQRTWRRLTEASPLLSP